MTPIEIHAKIKKALEVGYPESMRLIIKIIENFERESYAIAWNDAIELAANKANIKKGFLSTKVDKDSILNLKK